LGNINLFLICLQLLGKLHIFSRLPLNPHPNLHFTQVDSYKPTKNHQCHSWHGSSTRWEQLFTIMTTIQGFCNNLVLKTMTSKLTFKEKWKGHKCTLKQKVGSLSSIANTNESLNCGYRSNLTHSWILKHFGVENNHFKTHLAQELNKKWKAQNCNLKHKLGYGFGELLMIVNINMNIILNCVKV